MIEEIRKRVENDKEDIDLHVPLYSQAMHDRATLLARVDELKEKIAEFIDAECHGEKLEYPE
jgi:NAD(P)H-dependent FMN reductase